MAAEGSRDVAYQVLKDALRRRLVHVSTDLPSAGKPPLPSQAAVMEQLMLLLQERSHRALAATLDDSSRQQLVGELLYEMAGLGPLDGLLSDPTISEIMVHGPEKIFIERQGRVERVAARFHDGQELSRCVERLLGPLSRQVTEAQPFVDATLPDGSRLNVVIPPASPDGPTITIRKAIQRFTLQDLIQCGTLTAEVADFLTACITTKLNIIISGGTSTGKTTLVTALSAALDPAERVITIENVSELLLTHRTHWIRLVGRAPNIQGKGEISIRQLVANALRMRPDRIILGEARGEEALDIIQAMQTGHQGCITVLHADSPQGAMDRLETLMLFSGLELAALACRQQIGHAIDLAIHMARLPDGSRRIVSVTEVVEDRTHGAVLRDIFVLQARATDQNGRLQAALQPTGYRPQFLQRFTTYNRAVNEAWFGGSAT